MARVPPKTAERLFLIDAYALIYRSYFALVNRPLTSSRGENTSAAWGFVNFLLRIREEHAPDYLAVVFDAGSSDREKEFPEYKGTREKMPDELTASLPRIRELVAAFHDEVVELDGYEADDVIGTLARQASDAGLEAVIVSGDKDFHQLVGPRVHLLNPGRGGPTGVAEEWLDESNASERFGVPPEQVVDFLALVGDASDNIPGAPGIGEGWARRLLTEVGSLDELLADPERIPWNGKRDAVAGHVEQIRQARRLVKIKTDLPLTLDLGRLRVREPDLKRLYHICVELEFRTLIEKLGAAAGGPSRREGSEPRYRALMDPPELARLIRAARESEVVAVATEATTPDPMRASLVGISLAWKADSAIYLPFGHESPPASLLEGEEGSGPPGNLPPLTSDELSPLVELLQDRTVPKVSRDLKTDLLLLRRSGVEIRGGSAEHDGGFLRPRSGTPVARPRNAFGRPPRPRPPVTGGGHGKREEPDPLLRAPDRNCGSVRLRARRPRAPAMGPLPSRARAAGARGPLPGHGDAAGPGSGGDGVERRPYRPERIRGDEQEARA